MICLILFSKFSYVLLAFTCACAFINLRSICLGANILIPFPFLIFIKVKDFFNNIDYFFFRFSFSGISILLIEFFRLINDSLIFFTILPFYISIVLLKMMNNGN